MENLENPKYIKTVEGFDIWFTPLVEYILLDVEDYDKSYFDGMCKDIDSGKLEYFCAYVEAKVNGITLGDEYLGACIYESFEDFYTKYESDYFSDMVKEAIEEAKETLKGINQTISI